MLNPNEVETFFPVRRSLGYSPAFEIVIPPSKEAVLPFAILTNTTAPVHVYTDGSGFENGKGASALLYINDCLSRSLHFYLGMPQENMVYKAEGVGLIMGLHLLNRLSRQLTNPTVLGTDSQAVIKSLNNQLAHSGWYLLDTIHRATERLHEKQDGLINCTDHLQAIKADERQKGKSKGVIDLQVHWVTSP